jgi:hypothetical protein
MPIQNMPTQLQSAIQLGFLETEFRNGLTSRLAYRKIADREPVSINVGESVTKTRQGFKAPVTTPLNPANNTNLDNGMTPTATAIEQYVVTINQYGDSTDLNIVTSQVGIANQFLLNAKVNGVQAAQSLDRLARNALFGTGALAYQGGYMGGNTRVRTTLGSPAATINVDDVRGFGSVLANGVFQPVSGSYTAQVQVGSNTYTLTGVSIDGTNVSTSVFGISGTLTFSASVLVADATALNTVAHGNCPVLIRPNGKWTGGSAFSALTSTAALTASDILTLSAIEDGVANLRNNTGLIGNDFDFYLDNVSMRQLFADADFKQAFQGQYGAREWREGMVFKLGGVNYVPTTEAPVQAHPTNASLKVRRPILCAQGALVEGDFSGMEQKAAELSGMNSEINFVEGVCQVTRGPLDRLAQIVAQSWFWIGGFVTPTDATATTTIIPTAGAQYLKRAVVFEHC